MCLCEVSHISWGHDKNYEKLSREEHMFQGGDIIEWFKDYLKGNFDFKKEGV